MRTNPSDKTHISYFADWPALLNIDKRLFLLPDEMFAEGLRTITGLLNDVRHALLAN